MYRRTRMFQLLTILVLGFTSTALAGDVPQLPAGDGAAVSTEPGTEAGATPAGEEGVAAAAAIKPDLDAAMYGVAFRFRWVSVPSWFLGLFTKKNVALSSYGYAVEGFRRKRDRDDPNRTWELSVGIGYQNMSPPDGYWLGKSKDIKIDTDLVQMRNFSLITMDAAFITRQYFTPYFGIHYGAGLGLAIVRGKILRTSARCDNEPCHVQIPNVCGALGQAACTEKDFAASQTRADNGPGDPHRFEETSVPPAIPILNILVGLDFRIPQAKGLEFRLEGGFFNAFFLGGTAGWVF